MLLLIYILIGKEIMNEKDKELIKELYNKGLSCSKISKIVPYSQDAIWQNLNKMGCNTSRNIFQRLSKEDIDNICKDYINKVPTSEILKKYPFIKCQNTIIKVVKSQNVKVRGVGIPTKIKKEDYFKNIQTQEQAYIVGLLIADGSVIYPNRKNRNPIWTITLHDKDKYLLEQIQDIIGIEKKLYHTRNESILTVTSSQMITDLKQYGIIPRKSFKTHYPQIDSSFNRHLIRGIFDGDGCISNQTATFYGTESLLQGIQEVLANELGFPQSKITIRETNGANSFSFSSKDKIISFYNYIYNDASIYLKRKKDKFDKLDFISKC